MWVPTPLPSPGVLKGGQQLLCVLIRPTQTPYRIFSDKPTLNLTLHIWPWREGERFLLFLVCMYDHQERRGGKKAGGGSRICPGGQVSFSFASFSLSSLYIKENGK